MHALENRIPPPLVFMLVGVSMWIVAQTAPALELSDVWRFGVAAGFALLGGLFAFPAIRAFVRAKTTINPIDINAASSLVTSGIYRYSRNPMYVGLTALLLGFAVYLATPWAFLGPVAFMLFITRFQIIPEERVLQSKFGLDYEAYQKRVRRWL